MITTAADTIGDARGRAGLTQAELGARAGLPQSAVSAYETGAKDPSTTVLARLVEAAGFDLALGLVARQAGGRPAAAFSGPVGRRVQPGRAPARAWLRAHGFGSPQVFGSVSRGDDRDDSDLDVLVDLPDGLGLFGLGSARTELESIFGVPVDLVPRGSLKDDVAARVSGDLVSL